MNNEMVMVPNAITPSCTKQCSVSMTYNTKEGIRAVTVWKSTMTYKTKEVMLLALIYCHHNNNSEFDDALWSVANPKQSKFLNYIQVEEFLWKLQFIAIKIPIDAE